MRFQDGKSIGSAQRAAAAAPGAAVERPGQRFEVGHGAGGRELAFVDRDLQRFLERHHQLDALERAQSELVDRRRAGRRMRPGAKRCDDRARTLARLLPGGAGGVAPAAPADRSSQSRSSRRFSFCVPSVRGSSPPGHGVASRIFW